MRPTASAAFVIGASPQTGTQLTTVVGSMGLESNFWSC